MKGQFSDSLYFLGGWKSRERSLRVSAEAPLVGDLGRMWDQPWAVVVNVSVGAAIVGVL